MLSLADRQLAARYIAKREGVSYKAVLRRLSLYANGDVKVSRQTIESLTAITHKRGGSDYKELRRIKRELIGLQHHQPIQIPKRIFFKSEPLMDDHNPILWADERYRSRDEAIEFANEYWDSTELPTNVSRYHLTVTDNPAGQYDVLNHVFSKKDKSTHLESFPRHWHLIFVCQVPAT